MENRRIHVHGHLKHNLIIIATICEATLRDINCAVQCIFSKDSLVCMSWFRASYRLDVSVELAPVQELSYCLVERPYTLSIYQSQISARLHAPYRHSSSSSLFSRTSMRESDSL
jgi:hypothetical protein